MSFPRLWTLHAFCTVVLCLCLFLQFWTETVHQRRRPPEPVRSVEVDRVRPPILGIVVALSVEEVTFVVESLERWSSRCSGTTLDSVDLILYFAGDLPAHEPERHFSSPCFSMTRMVSASIYAKVSRTMLIHELWRHKLLHAFIAAPNSDPTRSTVALSGRPGSSEVPRNPLTRWDVSSIPANGIFLTKKLKNKTKNAQRVEND